MSATTYSDEFFEDLATGSRRSAARVLPLVRQAVQPRSVVDVGCGIGGWLAEWMALGVTDVLGVDGDYVSRSQLEIPEVLFEAHDLRQPLKLNRRFDLAESLEVAEHLPPERGESLVADLVALAPAVLFSAAIPGQTGTDHINERWQDYWQALFAAHGYVAVDLVRSVVWSDPAVESWYSQNAILYVASADTIPEHVELPMRLVHPRTHENTLAVIDALMEPRVPTLREIASQLVPAVRQSVRHRLGKAGSRD